MIQKGGYAKFKNAEWIRKAKSYASKDNVAKLPKGTVVLVTSLSYKWQHHTWCYVIVQNSRYQGWTVVENLTPYTLTGKELKLYFDIFNEKGKLLKTVSLEDCRVTGGESAINHRNIRRLHSRGGGYQKALDIVPWLSAGYSGSYNTKHAYRLRANLDVKIIEQAKYLGNFVAFKTFTLKDNEDYEIVHVDSHNFKVGEVVQAGKYICKIATSANNGGFLAHSHWDAKSKSGRTTRQLIFD